MFKTVAPTRDINGHFVDDAPQLPAWLTCTYAEFLRYLQRVEQRKGITWQRVDAYSTERGSERA